MTAPVCKPQGFLDLFVGWLKAQLPPDEERDEERDEEDDDETPDVDVVPPPSPVQVVGVRSVGAWAGLASIANAKTIRRDVDFMRAVGINRVDIILNDHSKWRAPTPFNTYNLGDVRAFANACAAADIAIHFMTWIMPHKAYIERAGQVIVPLMKDCGAVSTVLDAEEPWTKASSPLPWADAAKRVRDAFGDVRLGTTAIGYCSQTKLRALMALSDYWVPQCYATARSGLDPATVVPRFVKLWRRKFGAAKPFVPGLASYRQTGFPNKMSPETAVTSAFAGAEALGDVSEVIYWSLSAIRTSNSVTKAVKKLTAKGVVA